MTDMKKTDKPIKPNHEKNILTEEKIEALKKIDEEVSKRLSENATGDDLRKAFVDAILEILKKPDNKDNGLSK